MKKKRMSMKFKPRKKQLREYRFRVGFFMKVRLIIQGMISAKKALEKQDECPFMVCENAKTRKFYYDISLKAMKKIQKEKILFENYCALYNSQSSDVIRLLDKLKQTVGEHETVTIKTGLPNRINELLDVKRKSEETLDKPALRIRRFKEYLDGIRPLRHELKLLREDVQETYNMLVICNSLIEIIDNQADEAVRKFCEYTNLRVGWYWYGVFLKIKDVKSLKTHIIDTSTIDAIISENREARDRKITDIYTRHTELMMRMDCLSIDTKEES